MPRTRYSESRACIDYSPRRAAGLIIAAVFLSLTANACSSGFAGSTQFTDRLREQRATAERLCAERGGVEQLAPIPDQMDVLTIFGRAGVYRVERGPVEPNSHRSPSYQIITHVPRSEMINYTRAWGPTAYVTASHFLSTGRVRSVDLLLEDFQYHDNSRPIALHDGFLLPDRSGPNGVYRYSLEAAGHADCSEFENMTAAFAEQGFQYGYTPQQEFNTSVQQNFECVAIRFVGPKSTYTPPSYIYHEYYDDLPEFGVSQLVDELISPGGQIIARLRNFTAASRIGHCIGGTTNILEHYVYN